VKVDDVMTAVGDWATVNDGWLSPLQVRELKRSLRHLAEEQAQEQQLVRDLATALHDVAKYSTELRALLDRVLKPRKVPS
jgi:hypothetical protein